MIKLWDSQKNMLAEISLDNTLSTACFLNSSGKILLAFKNDIYTLPLSKALGLLETDIDSCSISAAGNLHNETLPEFYCLFRYYSILILYIFHPTKGYCLLSGFFLQFLSCMINE